MSEKYLPGPDASCKERLMTPRFVLGLWTFMNFFTYFDRGAIAAALPAVSADHSIDGGGHPLSNAAGGALVSAFMVGYFVTCPIFAGLGGTFSAKNIIVFGLCVWAVACVSTGFSQNYYWCLFSRMFVGVGEAAYAGYTVTIIDNMAPAKGRTLWIGTYFSMIPVGTALGMGVSGVVSSNVQLGSLAGWRLIFLAEVIPMIPIILLNFLLPTKYNPVKGTKGGSDESSSTRQKGGAKEGDDSVPSMATINTSKLSSGDSDDGAGVTDGDLSKEDDGDDFVTLPQAVKHLACNVDYILLVFGYAMYTFVIGAIAVWAISMLEESPLHMDPTFASLFMGGATAFSGLVGSVIGGVFVDKMGGSQGVNGLIKCQQFNVGAMLIAVPCGAVAMSVNSLPLFAVAFFIGVLCAMSITAPVTAAQLTVVPPSLRTYSVSFAVFFMHMLGDFPSPVVTGKISDSFDGGCSALSNSGKAICEQHLNCWYKANKTAHESPICVNEYQLRYSLLIVWGFMALCIPSWGFVLYRALKRKKQEAQRDEMSAGLINSEE